MLDRTLLALANQRGSAEDYGEHGQTVDDLHDRVEPAWHHVGIEHAPDNQIDRCFAAAFTPSFEVGDLVFEDALDIVGAVARLRNGRRVNINLDVCWMACQHIGFEFGRHDHHEHHPSLIESGIHFGGGQRYGPFEL